MLFKMLGIERAWESYRETMPKPRQLFVTQSRVLAEKVEEYFAKLLDSLATASQSPRELVKMAARKQQQQQQGLVDRDEEIYWRGDLPKRYGALQEENFPMFLTYDHVRQRRLCGVFVRSLHIWFADLPSPGSRVSALHIGGAQERGRCARDAGSTRAAGLHWQ